MTAVALFVEFEIDPDQITAFDALIADHAAKTLAGEPGCMDFQVHVDRADPNTYLLYELYRDDAALVAHREGAQLAKFRAKKLCRRRLSWVVRICDKLNS